MSTGRPHATCSVTVPGLVVLSVHRVRRGNYTAARIEGGMDAGLGDGDSLLLHDLVNRHSIVLRNPNMSSQVSSGQCILALMSAD